MGIFDKLKKRLSSDAGELEALPEIGASDDSALPPPLPTLPPPLPTQSQIVGTDSLCTVQPKRIADYFVIDMASITPADNDETIILDQRELGVFDYVKPHYDKDSNLANIEFRSLAKRFSPELIDFIKVCTETFGLTSFGEGEITARDEKLLLMGRFSRMWHNVWIDCGPDEENGGLTALRLTIFNPESTLDTVNS